MSNGMEVTYFVLSWGFSLKCLLRKFWSSTVNHGLHSLSSVSLLKLLPYWLCPKVLSFLLVLLYLQSRHYWLYSYDIMEGEMVTHSSILTWRIPWTGESGGLPMGLQMDGHDLATNTYTHSYYTDTVYLHFPALGAQSLSHWITREVPNS